MLTNVKPLLRAQRQQENQPYVSRLQGRQKQGLLPRQKLNTSIQQPNKIQRCRTINNHHSYPNANKIIKQNQKLLTKILEISKRKYSCNISLPSSNVHKQLRNNPARKKRQRQIKIANISLAERLLNQQSQFSTHKMLKEIKQYEKIKNSIRKNKKINLLPSIIKQAIPYRKQEERSNNINYFSEHTLKNQDIIHFQNIGQSNTNLIK